MTTIDINTSCIQIIFIIFPNKRGDTSDHCVFSSNYRNIRSRFTTNYSGSYISGHAWPRNSSNSATTDTILVYTDIPISLAISNHTISFSNNTSHIDIWWGIRWIHWYINLWYTIINGRHACSSNSTNIRSSTTTYVNITFHGKIFDNSTLLHHDPKQAGCTYCSIIYFSYFQTRDSFSITVEYTIKCIIIRSFYTTQRLPFITIQINIDH